MAERTLDMDIHERWLEMTDGGVLDSRVGDTERMFGDLRDKLRARFNTPEDVLEQLDSVRNKTIERVKQDIVLSSHWSGFGVVRGTGA